MKKSPIYSGTKSIKGCNDEYGVKVVAYFYVGDEIIEGDPFGNSEGTNYVDDMGPEWQKGHMLAKSLGGDNELHNLLPMKEDVNNSSFKKVENFVHTLFDNLADIQRLCNVGTLHIRYTVERVLNPVKTVKGHKFPGKFTYSIEFLKSDEQNVNSTSLMNVLESLDISNDVNFTDTLSVD